MNDWSRCPQSTVTVNILKWAGNVNDEQCVQNNYKGIENTFLLQLTSFFHTSLCTRCGWNGCNLTPEACPYSHTHSFWTVYNECWYTSNRVHGRRAHCIGQRAHWLSEAKNLICYTIQSSHNPPWEHWAEICAWKVEQLWQRLCITHHHIFWVRFKLYKKDEKAC